MRKTLWFAWLFTMIYTIAAVVVDTVTERNLFHATVVDGRFIFHGILVQVLTLIGGAIRRSDNKNSDDPSNTVFWKAR